MKKRPEEIRKDFPILARTMHGHPLCYLDNAATTQVPQVVIDRVRECYMKHHANTYRGAHGLGEEATLAFEDARARIAKFIGAQDSSEVSFSSGCTGGINCVAFGWARSQFKPGDEILITELEHHSNLVPWQQVAAHTGAVLKWIPVTPDGLLAMDQLDQLVTDRTKLVSVTTTANAIGTQLDLPTIIAAAKSVGARVLIDAAQSPVHEPIDVTELGADFCAISSHKMFGPTGVGALYVNKALHDQMVPCRFGGGMVETATMETATFRPMPQLLEAGTPPIAQAIGMGAAVRYIEENIDLGSVHGYESSLCARLINGLEQHKEIRLLGPVSELKRTGHLISFLVDGIHAHDVTAYLDQAGICARAGNHCAQPIARALGYEASTRISFCVYNLPEEVDRVLDTITHMLREHHR